MTENPELAPAPFSIADEIAKLVALKDAGHLSEEEFQQQKSRLLGGTAAPPSPPEEPAAPPIDAPPPSFARTVVKKESHTQPKPWVVVVAVVGVLILLLILSKACTPAPRSSVSYTPAPLPEVPAWAPPEGFTKSVTDNGVFYGMRWLTGKEYSCDYGDRCWGMEVVTAESCPNTLYVQISLLNKNDVDVGWTNDTAQAVPANQKVRLVFESYEDGARSARLGKISCY